MIRVLYDDQRIARTVLSGHVPRCLRRAGAAAHLQAGALSQRIKRQAAMLADNAAGIGLDRTL